MEKKKVLIVEDEFIIADVLQDYVQKGGYTVCGMADTVDEAMELTEKLHPDLVLLDIFLKGKKTGIDFAKTLSGRDIPFIYISANSTSKILEMAKMTNPSGFVVKPFREKDVLVALDIAIYRHTNSRENILREYAGFQKKVAGILESAGNWKEKIMALGHALQPFFPYEFFSIGCHSENSGFNDIGFLRIGFDEYQYIGPNEMSVITKLKMRELAALQALQSFGKVATWYDETEFQEHLINAPLKKRIAENYDLKSHLYLPIPIDSQATIVMNFYSRRPDAYQADHLLLSERFNPLLLNLFKQMIADENNPFNFKSKNSAVIAVENIPGGSFDGIVGRSHLLLNVFDQIMQVAPHNSSVLILGESGTGKEKIAERIHHLSPRNGKPFIKVNCGALPTTLIDSELFGHEKGAFTGAYDRKIGRFEQADKGSIFLDEIGDLPLELQVKLLRVLQEREFERLGGRGTIKIDVRIIAATNRDLEKEVAEGRFRLDLFYRLNVIQIMMPALRERKEDIPLLAEHFLRIYNKKAGKSIKQFSQNSQGIMANYSWPGNIRELENLIERNVLLCRTDIIEDVGLSAKAPVAASNVLPMEGILPMSENERVHILAALKKCNGKIWGTGGAAELLNLPPTTLNSKMKKLGINKDFLD